MRLQQLRSIVQTHGRDDHRVVLFWYKRREAPGLALNNLGAVMVSQPMAAWDRARGDTLGLKLRP
jgi:hypothetical protein